jgi:uncharacterized membrane protein YkvA (DUF1232 family)
MKIFRFLGVARASLPRVLPLMRDVRVPLWLKIGSAVMAVLIISPLDIFGDIPVLGIVDDLALLAILANAFVAVAERFMMQPAREPNSPKIVTPTNLAR